MKQFSDLSLPLTNRREFLIRLSGAVWGIESIRHATGAFALSPSSLRPGENTRTPSAYQHYVQNSKDFKRVKQNKAWCERAFPGWLSMPWTYQWTVGYTEASGRWSLAHGYNGAFLDGNGGSPDSPPGKLDWINRNGLRFYMDHTAGKGDLHLWDGDKKAAHLKELHGNGVRAVPVNDALKQKLFKVIKNNVSQVKSSPFRAAYALDDEPSWGHFTHPTMWCITDDPSAYKLWLKEVYGSDAAPTREKWITYEDIRPSLSSWTVADFDASPLLDQWSFNDSVWCNLVGDLVEYANTVDPQTPCGFVGGQAPNAFGGYDYAKLMRKIQYLEAYNLGSSQAIVRSFNPHNAIPCVTSTFHKSAEDDIWQIWYYLAHGNRGHIGWVENWFDGETAKPWHKVVAPHALQAGKVIGPLMQGTEWMHDGVAIYYSHASVQLGWVLDAEAHGKTWVNRDGDHRLGASHHVRGAWENMLRDSGLQYDFLSYVDVIQHGVPDTYRVLILPACLCLSDVEAQEIEAFCRRGGTVIADYLPGVWDQHGRGRKGGGALDRLFGVKHDPAMKAEDVFGTKGWYEVDQDANFGWKTYKEFLTKENTCLKDSTGFHKAVRKMPIPTLREEGRGKAILMNLSPQWYNAYRIEGYESAKHRETFMKPFAEAGLKRWVEIEGVGEAEFGCEITYFRKANGRKVLFVISNPEITGSELGGGNASHLKTGIATVTLKFAKPIRNVRDERQAKALEDGERFKFNWAQNEAIVLSFD